MVDSKCTHARLMNRRSLAEVNTVISLSRRVPGSDLVSVISVPPPCSLWLCGESLVRQTRHRDIEGTEEAHRLVTTGHYLRKIWRAVLSAIMIACLFLVFAPHGLAGATTTAAQAGSNEMIVTASAVRMRVAPQVTSREVTRLKLGTVVRVLERSAKPDTVGQKQDYWYRVSSSDGKTGWVFGGLMSDFDPDNRDETYRRLAAERLKMEKATYEDHVDLVNFLSHALNEVKQTDTKAELELDSLLALKLSLEAIPFDKQAQPPYSVWVKKHDAKIVYSEPAGLWLVRAELFWNLQKKYSSLPIAERIAWEAARIYLPGECEGYVPCYVHLSRLTDGEYLKLYPEGAHASAALKSMAEGYSPIISDLAERKIYEGPPDESERADFRKTLDELRAIVMKTTAPEKDEVLKQIDQLTQSYG